ncbi:hypothetical protein [Sphingomonas sp. PR090111-T3T-6A]|uniref:hypothetical protein n=1 Tax=Sphingomonas sp. PR090111-T3T-6A TaxID=685778 RepID=UPI0003A505DC|nr:hypothetical protein [Sphingomonas sp. PR090111-T3T-6A]
MAGLAPALFIGAVAGVAVPWIAERSETTLNGLLAGRLIHLPIDGGIELPWSWLVFAGVTLIAWAAIAVARIE